MLADPRSKTLIDNFAEQWLHLRNLKNSDPDLAAFPDFDDNLRQAMKEETSCSSTASCAKTAASWTCSTPTTPSSTSGWRGTTASRTSTAAGSAGCRCRANAPRPARSGEHPDGDVVSEPHLAGRARQVGADEPARRAAAAAAAEHPAAAGGAARTARVLPLRERLEKHRADPVCAGCHRAMDPIGFALENFDGIGRWRTNEDGQPIDASGTLFNGAALDGVVGAAPRDREAAGCLRRRPDREDDDLRGGPRDRALRHACRAEGRAGRPRHQLPLLVDRARRREERAVPDEGDQRGHTESSSASR